jgi:hypothetical protein
LSAAGCSSSSPVARFEDTDLVHRVTALALRLGGEPDEVFYRPDDGRPRL